MPGQTEGWMEGQKDGQTLFHRTFLANVREPKRHKSSAWRKRSHCGQLVACH